MKPKHEEGADRTVQADFAGRTCFKVQADLWLSSVHYKKKKKKKKNWRKLNLFWYSEEKEVQPLWNK